MTDAELDEVMERADVRGRTARKLRKALREIQSKTAATSTSAVTSSKAQGHGSLGENRQPLRQF